MGYRNVISLQCRLNCTEEGLFPNSLKTHLGSVGGSAFTHLWEHKHTGAIVTTSEDQRAGVTIRQMTYLVCACEESLSTHNKLERQLNNDIVAHFRICSHTASNQKSDLWPESLHTSSLFSL